MGRIRSTGSYLGGSGFYPSGGGGASFDYLFDTYGADAEGGYSLRALSSTYMGDCIRVRRSSDNAEADIGFSNNVLDTTALLAHVGANDGFVTTWYDQSGNGNDLVQASAVTQPRIVNSGSVELSNGNPTIRFGVSISTGLGVALGVFSERAYFVITEELGSPISSFHNFVVNGTSPFYQFYSAGTNFQYFYSATANDTGLSLDLSMQLAVLNHDATTASYFKDGVAGNTDAIVPAAVAGTYSIGRSGANGLNGNISELIIYSAEKSTDRANIETQINNFYTIY